MSSNSTSNSTRASTASCMPLEPGRQSGKKMPPNRNHLAKKRTLAPGQRSCKNVPPPSPPPTNSRHQHPCTPSCLPPSTRSLILQNCAHSVTSISSSTCASTPSCMPPSTLPSILQIAFPSLLEVRTPTAFSYLGNTWTVI